jgi:Major Facilitator Superfamily
MPVGAVALAVVALRLHLPRRTHRHRVDYLGAALLAAGVGALTLFTTWGGNEYAWGSGTMIGLAGAGVAFLAAFVWQETRAAEPIIPLDLFRSGVFRVANAMGFLIGLAMFGAIFFIPLFLQTIYGATPTGSGLRTVPLMAGLLVAAIVSGRAIARIGKYKVFPIVGTATLALGMYLLSLLGAGTSIWLASAYMTVVGIGIGLVMQVLVLVVQNDSPPGAIGVATSTATFFRSVGGSFGVAIFGAIFASRLAAQLKHLPADVVAKLGSGVHLNPEQARQLPPKIHAEFLDAFANALHGVFVWGLILALVPFALSWFLKEVPLRTSLHRSVDAEEPITDGVGPAAFAE